MCANYLPPHSERLRKYFDVDVSDDAFKPEIFPGYFAPIIRLSDDGSDQAECIPACFGIVPPWADLKLARHTYNARTETVASKPTYRHAFRKRQFCIVPADAIFEPNYASGKAVRWKISDAKERPMGVAGIWEWRPNGGIDDRPLVSFSMLTINANEHPLMRRFHKPEDEKRMVVILAPEQYETWLHTNPENAPDFFKAYPAEQLIAEAAPRSVTRQPDLLSDELAEE